MNDINQLPAEIDAAICKGLRIVETNHFHDLIYSHRGIINRLFDSDSLQYSNGKSNRKGHWRRYYLGVLTTENALPCWKRSFPNDESPCVWLKAARQVMLGEYTEKECKVMRDHADNYCGKLVCNHQDLQNDVAVGYAALQVIRIALWDDLYPTDIKDETTDGDLDPDDLDYAYCAAVAWSGGTIWNKSSSATQRLEFWRWWLTVAVPEAWHSQGVI